jgi:hypothetical protein
LQFPKKGLVGAIENWLRDLVMWWDIRGAPAGNHDRALLNPYAILQLQTAGASPEVGRQK